MKSRLGAHLAALALAALSAVSFPASAGLTQLTSLFVFGDSLSDGGNSGLRTAQYTQGLGLPPVVFPPPPYYNGQYSNGRVAVEYLWNAYHPGDTSFKPSLAGGTNYAIGGATTGAANFNTITASVPPLLQPAFAGYGNAAQVQQFLTSSPTFDPATSLFVVWLFPNDVFGNYSTPALWPGPGDGPNPGLPADPAVLVANGINNIANTVVTLAARGAQHFLVPNMPDLGLTPDFINSSAGPLLSALTAGFNANLALALSQLDQLLSAEIVQFDTAGAFAQIRADPSAFGFENVTDSCVANLASGVCNPSNWDKWVFWDGVHPTTASHALLGAGFRAAVPEPASVMLLAIAFLALAWMRRQTRA
jgi:phospholipase/lecithinase/hemolysin